MRRPRFRTPGWGGALIDRRAALLGLAAVGGFLAVDIGAVLYAGGWVGGGGRLTPQTFLDGFQQVNGTHPGFRKNHAKGVVVAGHFDSNGSGAELTRAAIFQTGRTPVVGRFSLAGGNPNVSDATAAVRGLGLAFGFPGGEQWRVAMLNLPVFLDNSPQGFFDRLLASKPLPDTGKPDPSAMTRFLAAHPETARAMALAKQQPPTRGFSDSCYRGLNAFYFVSASGARTPVRWALAPVPPAPSAVAALSGPNGLFDDLVRHLRSGRLQWKLLVTIGAPSDPVSDATIAWPDDRRVVDTGTVTLDSVNTERAGNARDLNFDPLVLPDGIEPSADPLLSARSAVYAASFRRRSGEPAGAPAVDVDEVSL